jgi:3-phenylpropionate/trans-cinnamate dioxygenase ferredoxin reductase subunit
MTFKDPRASALALAEPVPADAEGRRIDHDAVQRAARDLLEHWANALNQAPAAARNMLGQSASYDRLPCFFSDQYDVGMEYSGLARGRDRVVLRGDAAEREFVAFWMFEDRVMAGMNVNVWDVIDPIRRLIAERIAVDERQLTDTDLPLDQLASAIRGGAA